MGRQTARNSSGNERARLSNPITMSLKIGFFAGVIWGLTRWLATGLNFTEVTQAFLADPFVKRAALGTPLWQFVGWLLFIAMSMVAAIIYLLVLGKLRGPWPGLLFGAVWWGLVYALAGPYIGAVPPLRLIGWSSLITDFCLFVVWGLFIGYSIAFELHDEGEREPRTESTQGSPQASS